MYDLEELMLRLSKLTLRVEKLEKENAKLKCKSIELPFLLVKIFKEAKKLDINLSNYEAGIILDKLKNEKGLTNQNIQDSIIDYLS